MIKRLRGCLLALALVLMASPAIAQGLQTGSLQGTVQDAGGLILPGVTVTVTSPSLQGTRTTSPTQTVFMCCARFHRDATT